MSRLEAKLQELWGGSTLVFCKRCGVPAVQSGCDHHDAAAWHELDERQRMHVRRAAIAMAKTRRRPQPVFTAAC